MSAFFDLCNDSDAPPYVRLDTLLETYGIEPAHVLDDPDSPMVVTIGSGRYLSAKDLARFLHWRAETALMQRMGRGAPPKPRFDYADEPSEGVPDIYRLPVEVALKAARAEADRISSPEPATA
jgi:hypothetical protein